MRRFRMTLVGERLQQVIASSTGRRAEPARDGIASMDQRRLQVSGFRRHGQ